MSNNNVVDINSKKSELVTEAKVPEYVKTACMAALVAFLTEILKSLQSR